MITMFVSNIACVPAGRLHGPVVVTMRPIAEAQVDLVRELSARYPHAHGALVHIGDPEAIRITDLRQPDYSEPVPIYPNEIPVFWACGVTPQAVAIRARVEFMITHEPADVRDGSSSRGRTPILTFDQEELQESARSLGMRRPADCYLNNRVYGGAARKLAATHHVLLETLASLPKQELGVQRLSSMREGHSIEFVVARPLTTA